jgi:hypothetical protein
MPRARAACGTFTVAGHVVLISRRVGRVAVLLRASDCGMSFGLGGICDLLVEEVVDGAADGVGERGECGDAGGHAGQLVLPDGVRGASDADGEVFGREASRLPGFTESGAGEDPGHGRFLQKGSFGCG